MKKSLLIILLSLLAITFPACRSQKEVTVIQPEPKEQKEPEETRWKNVSVPVRFDVIEPQKISLAGRLTMVRDKYALISLRMLGFEVGQIYITPEEANVVIKQVNKMWIHEPLASRLAELKIPFATLQEALLGCPEAFKAIPSGLDLTLGGTQDSPVLTLKLSPKGKTIMGSMTLSMNQAQWDSPRPQTFNAPTGSDYKKVALKDLGKFLK